MSMTGGNGSGKIRILIADDHEMVLDVFAMYLSSAPDMEVTTGKTLDEALDHITAAGPFDVVLLDLNMPGMNGFEMAELMRRNKKTQSIPIIFVTANGDKRHLFRGYEVGAVDYLAKPIDREVLISKVNVFLDLDRQRRELERQLQEIQHLKQQNEKLLLALGDGMVAVDAAGDISFVNPAMRHLFALDPEALALMMRNEGITVMQATPTTWHMLVDSRWTPSAPLKAALPI